MVPDKLTRAFGLAKLKAYQNRDKIYLGLGLVSLAGGTILLCRGARRLDGVLDRHEQRMKGVNDLPEEERKKAKAKCYMQTTGELIKDFGPGVVCWGAGAAGVAASNYVLTKDKQELLDYLSMASATHNAFYKRVEDEIGAEKAAELMSGTTEADICNLPSGEDAEVEKAEVKIAADQLQGVNQMIYGFGTTRYFDEVNLPFNMKNLYRARNEFETRIARNGYIVAGEVKSFLGVPRKDITSADWMAYKKFDDKKPIGQQLGWKLEELTTLEQLANLKSSTSHERAVLYDILVTFDFDHMMGKEMRLI